MRKKVLRLSLLILTITILTVCGDSNRESEDAFISGIKEVMPSGWTMETIDKPSAMGHPHGLEEPLFRIDFTDSVHQFYDSTGRALPPSLRLYFYDIGSRDAILSVIEKEKIYSWAVPEYFDQTRDYLIVTSPLYINSGHFSEEAMVLYRPLETALKEYFSKLKTMYDK